jgi:hypothetical protein
MSSYVGLYSSAASDGIDRAVEKEYNQVRFSLGNRPLVPEAIILITLT